MSAKEKPESTFSTLSRVFTPLRIISILAVFSIVGLKIPWDSALIVYYGFFGIFLSSFVIEVIHYGKNRFKIVGLAVKYLLILSFEFIGTFVFAMATLPFPNSQQIQELEIKVAIMVFGVSTICELYHYVWFSTEKIQLDIRKILAIIVMVVLSVYEAIFIYLFLLTSKPH